MSAPLRVGLVGQHKDEQIAALEAALAARAAQAVVVDFSTFPAGTPLHCADGRILYGGEDLAALDALHVRQSGYMWPTPQTVPTAEEWAAYRGRFDEYVRNERETLSLKYSALGVLSEILPVVNPQIAFRYHRMKPFAQFLLERAGVAVPPSLATNDPDAVAAFGEAHGWRIVVKTLAGGEEVVLADRAWLEAHRAELEQRPFLFQRFVEGRSLRGYVVGERLVSLREVLHGERVDWRAEQRGLAPWEDTARPEALAVLAARTLEMRFAGVDLEYDPQADAYALLDVNPAPLFCGYRRMGGDDIAEPLAEHLLELARQRRGGA